jgi:hypothetical protein
VPKKRNRELLVVLAIQFLVQQLQPLICLLVIPVMQLDPELPDQDQEDHQQQLRLDHQQQLRLRLDHQNQVQRTKQSKQERKKLKLTEQEKNREEKMKLLLQELKIQTWVKGHKINNLLDKNPKYYEIGE